MDQVILAQIQFAATSIFHFFFVPLTLGLSVLLAVMQTQYVRTGDENYKKMTKFWGKLFLINFAIGVVTGIVQEFQFGMNWSEYSRFVGDIFGVPLAIEALMAFYLESTFIAVWVFGWDKLSKKVHLASIWLVALASNLSALWILIANSWMQQPTGYKMATINGKELPQLVDFGAILFNSHVWLQFPHVLFAGLGTAAFFIMGVSAYHLLRKQQIEIFRKSMNLAIMVALVSSIMVATVGHFQGQHVGRTQPMKLAAMEALWQSENPAGLSLFAWINEKDQKNSFDIKLPNFLSFMVHDSFTGEVKGIKEIQKDYEKKYGPGDYIPPVFINYWSFRIMVGIGMTMIFLAMLGFFLSKKNKLLDAQWYLKILPFFLLAPYLANSTGWIVAEVGRQPWIVQGLLKVQDAVSPFVTAGEVGLTLVLYILLYGALITVDVFLLIKYARKGVTD